MDILERYVIPKTAQTIRGMFTIQCACWSPFLDVTTHELDLIRQIGTVTPVRLSPQPGVALTAHERKIRHKAQKLARNQHGEPGARNN